MATLEGRHDSRRAVAPPCLRFSPFSGKWASLGDGGCPRGVPTVSSQQIPNGFSDLGYTCQVQSVPIHEISGFHECLIFFFFLIFLSS